MSSHSWLRPKALALAAAGVMIVMVAAGAAATRAQGKRVSPPGLEPVTASAPIVAHGRFEPGDGVIRVGASGRMAGARVAELRVREGDAVSRGDVIAVLDTRPLAAAELRQAEARLEVARARLAQMHESIEPGLMRPQRISIATAHAELERAIAQRRRAERLHETKLIADAELEAFRLDETVKRRQVDQLESILEKLTAVTPGDVRIAQAELRTAEADLDRAEAELDLAVIRAPVDGRILRVQSRPGEVVSSSGIVEVGEVSNMYAVAEVYEADAARVRRGQRAEIVSAGLATPLLGTVERVAYLFQRNDVVANDPVPATEERVIEVRVKLDDSRAVEQFTNLQVIVRIGN